MSSLHRKTLMVLDLVLSAMALTILVLIITGHIMLAVVEGRSMEPTLQTGDLVIILRDRGSISVGDVIVYYKNSDSLVIHRVVRIYVSKDGIKYYVTKGDNNIHADPPIPESRVAGKALEINDAVIKVPLIGYISLGIRGIIGST